MRNRKTPTQPPSIWIMTIAVLAMVMIMFSACSDSNTQTADSGKDMDYQIMLNITESPSDSMVVTWSGDHETDSYVEYDKTDSRGSDKAWEGTAAICTTVREDEYYRYSATLTGLEPATEYTYTVGDKKNRSEEHTFKTAKKDASFEFLYFGDIQYQVKDRDYAVWSEYMTNAYEQNPDSGLVLMGGDMVEKSSDVNDWGSFFKYSEPLFSKLPVAPAVGNHETSVIPYTYKQMLTLPSNGPAGLEEEFYSFDYGNCHFMAVNSCFFMDERKRDYGDGQWEQALKEIQDWIETDLKNNEQKTTIAFMHHPPYPLEEDDPIYRDLRESIVPCLEKGGVSLVLCGHQHVYMKTKEINGITYIMSSSGQKPSYYYDESKELPDYIENLYLDKSYISIDTDDNKLKIRSYDKDHNLIENTTIDP